MFTNAKDKLIRDLDLTSILKKTNQHEAAIRALLTPTQYEINKLQLGKSNHISAKDKARKIAKVSASNDPES
jgi:hypothetical protein